jgi:hypothetical protein
LDVRLDRGFELAGVVCARKTIVPYVNDYKVVTGRTGLMISDIGEGHPQRMGKLERVDGRFRFQITQGEPLTDDLAARVAARLEFFEKTAQPPN